MPLVLMVYAAINALIKDSPPQRQMSRSSLLYCSGCGNLHCLRKQIASAIELRATFRRYRILAGKICIEGILNLRKAFSFASGYAQYPYRSFVFRFELQKS